MYGKLVSTAVNESQVETFFPERSRSLSDFEPICGAISLSTLQLHLKLLTDAKNDIFDYSSSVHARQIIVKLTRCLVVSLFRNIKVEAVIPRILGHFTYTCRNHVQDFTPRGRCSRVDPICCTSAVNPSNSIPCPNPVLLSTQVTSTWSTSCLLACFCNPHVSFNRRLDAVRIKHLLLPYRTEANARLSLHSPTFFLHDTSFRSRSPPNLIAFFSMKLISLISAVIAAVAFTVSVEALAGPVWGYRSSDTSMVHTSKWNTNWAACGGARQSPVDIVTTGKSENCKKNPLNFSGKCSRFNLTEPHEPLEVDVAGGEAALHDAPDDEDRRA